MKISGSSFAAGAVFALVIGSGSAVAATGGKFILGQANSANRTSTLTNSAGTALTLNSKAGTPSLRVNRTTKVPNLNADLLDGVDSSQLALKSGQTGVWFSTGPLEPVDFEDDGNVDALAALAVCPAGTIVTGGGLVNEAGSPVLASFGEQDYWVVMTDDLTATANSFGATATCYNPRGAVAPQFRQGDSSARQQLRQAARAR